MSNFCIYRPAGRAGEYSQWAANIYVGCTNNCSYCYLKHGVSSGTLGGTTPTIKKSLGGNETDAYRIFCKELNEHKPQIGDLFFTFTSDPCLPETVGLQFKCVGAAIQEGVHCTLLTKRADFLGTPAWQQLMTDIYGRESFLRIGFTLTGRDDVEPYASPNVERIATMKLLHDSGFSTWASIEPIVDLKSSFDMIVVTSGFCDHYKIGPMTGCKSSYTLDEFKAFAQEVRKIIPDHMIYWKDSVKSLV